MTLHAHDWLARWAYYTPDKNFLREESSNRSWSYHEFDMSAKHCAQYLAEALNLKKGDRLAIYAQNRMEYFLLYFAAIKLGIILVPLNFRLTPSELDVLISDAEPQVFFYEQEYFDQVHSLTSISKNCDLVEIESLSSLLNSKDLPENLPLEVPEISTDDLVMILYTSGTTGLPKGAMISHKMLFWNAVNTGLRLDINSNDHTQAFSPLFHTGGWNVLFTPFLHHGASHTILKSFDPDLILKLIEKEGTTIMFGVPTMLQMIADSPSFSETDLSSLRYIIVGGAPMPIPLIELWHQRGIPIRQGYGLTEVGPNCFSLNEASAITKQGSIGFPNFYLDARIVGEDGHDMAANQPGELWLSSPVVSPGYWRKPAETETSRTEGWFHTGDMARRDEEGYYYIVDRKKNMFISGGENVYPAEIEARLIQHPHIKEAAVIGIPDEKWGEAGKAFIVGDQDLSIDELKAYCLKYLAKYKIPKEVLILKSLPVNETGKLDRKHLIRMHKQQKEIQS